jgi:hypothetical protein
VFGTPVGWHLIIFYGVVPLDPLLVHHPPPPPPPIQSAPRRALHHVLGVAVRGGITVNEPPHPPPPEFSAFVEWGVALPVSNPLSLVRCRSLFSQTMWVLRQLSAQELLAVFDIPQQERVTAATYHTTAALPFLHCAPLKALNTALTSWEPTKPLPLQPVDQTPCTAPLAMVYPKECFDHMVMLAADAVAVKADVVLAPTGMWDRRVWEGMAWAEQSARDFEERHGRGPLDSIRRLALRVWKQNVRVSYMS